MSNEELDKIREISIHSLLGRVHCDRNIVISCPIHKDRTPSFVLFPDNHYYCFSCQATGRGSIDFLMFLGATFQEAVKELEKLSTVG